MLDSSTLDLNTSTFTESNFTCPMPWKQVHITTKGDVYPCCLWTGQPMGSLRRSFLDSIWNREGFRGRHGFAWACPVRVAGRRRLQLPRDDDRRRASPQAGRGGVCVLHGGMPVESILIFQKT